MPRRGAVRSVAGMATHMTATSPRERLLAEIPATECRLELAGLPTAVLEGGDGPPVVLLHGPGANATHWLRRASPASWRRTA